MLLLWPSLFWHHFSCFSSLGWGFPVCLQTLIHLQIPPPLLLHPHPHPCPHPHHLPQFLLLLYWLV